MTTRTNDAQTTSRLSPPIGDQSKGTDGPRSGAATPAEGLASAFDFETYRRSLTMLKEDYYCPVCKGEGIYMGEGNNAYFCACRVVRQTLSRLKRQGLEQAARRLTFDAFLPDHPWQEQMLIAAIGYTLQKDPGWLFLGGQSGCGKTHLGTAAAVCLALRGLNFLYMPWSQATTVLKGLSVDERRSILMTEYADAQVLYIDDLFKSPPTESDKHIIFELLNARYNRDDRPTIISSERTLPELFAIDEALAGRIAERCGRSCIVNIARDPGKNYRFAAMM